MSADQRMTTIIIWRILRSNRSANNSSNKKMKEEKKTELWHKNIHEKMDKAKRKKRIITQCTNVYHPNDLFYSKFVCKTIVKQNEKRNKIIQNKQTCIHITHRRI